MTVISSGGFLPTNSLDRIITTNLQSIFLSLSFLVSLLNFYLIYNIFFNRSDLKNHKEDSYLVILIIIFSMLFYFIHELDLLSVFVNILSSIGTSGISLGEVQGNFALYLLILTLLGGSVLSTTSGIKFIRIYILIKALFAEMYKLVKPNVIISSNIIFSGPFTEDDFDTGGGEIKVGDVVTGLKVFRDELYIFCQRRIYKITGTSSSNFALAEVAKNVGTIANLSIQELGGDLIFLSADGLRTVAGTARIADVEIGSVSRKILPLINDLLDNIADYTLASMVIRERSQYRLFYFQSGQADASQKGIIGTFKFDEQGIPAFEWSNTKGLVVKTCTSDLNTSNEEVKFSADESGYVYLHDSGNNFNGENISGVFQTPDMDYGDNGLRKSLYAVKANIKPEGVQDDLKLRIRYDFESSDVPQPGVFSVGTLAATSLYGGAAYGTGTYGAVTLPSKRMLVIGSGFSNSFRFYSNDTNAAYAVNGLFVSFIAGGRR